MKKSIVTPIVFTLASSAFAQVSTLDPVIVTATRLDQDVFSVPFTAHVVDRSRFLDQRAVRAAAATRSTSGCTW